MKYAVVFILFLCFQARAEDQQTLVWLVAPQIWNVETPELKNSLQNLEMYLQQSLGGPVKVELKTGDGFALSQYYHLQESLKTSQPNYIFYIQSSRLFAKDFEEMLLSKNGPSKPLSQEVFNQEEILQHQPTWSKNLVPGFSIFLPLKKAVLLENRLNKHWKNEDAATDKAEFYLDIGSLPHKASQFLMKDKTKVIFLISPERIRYSREIFPDNALTSSIAQMFFQGENIDRNEVKEYLAYSGLNFQLLSAEFAQLSHPDSLVGGSRFVLNSSGTNKSFQIIKPVISSYLVMEKNRKENEEKIKAEAKKPKVSLKKAKAKAVH